MEAIKEMNNQEVFGNILTVRQSPHTAERLDYKLNKSESPIPAPRKVHQVS